VGWVVDSCERGAFLDRAVGLCDREELEGFVSSGQPDPEALGTNASRNFLQICEFIVIGGSGLVAILAARAGRDAGTGFSGNIVPNYDQIVLGDLPLSGIPLHCFNPMESPRKIAVLGAGFWSQFQIPAWRELSDVECAALCDINATKAKALADRFGVPRGEASRSGDLPKAAG
jgi:hypothetical protein